MFVVHSQQCYARPISEDKACVIATRFYYMKKCGGNAEQAKLIRALNLIYSPQYGEQVRLTPPEYYIFSPDNNKGFVIVSGDDRAGQLIVGYSLDSPISNNLSSSMLGFLNCYTKYIEDLRKGKAEPKPQRKSKTVTPLLKTTWGQYAPYNQHCPTLHGRKLATGCVTTAVAQIMKYHEWPTEGTGTCKAEIHNLDTTYTSVTLGETYNWSKMKDNYSSATKRKTDDIARLMRDVGHAVKIMYSPVFSFAYSEHVIEALTAHFRYSHEARLIHRYRYSDNEWNHVITEELLSGRPVYYSSRSTRFDGHAFVICGIDEQGFFYTNWGWGGNCDGYFDFDAVTSDNTEYNYTQSAIIGISPMREQESVLLPE